MTIKSNDSLKISNISMISKKVKRNKKYLNNGLNRLRTVIG